MLSVWFCSQYGFALPAEALPQRWRELDSSQALCLCQSTIPKPSTECYVRERAKWLAVHASVLHDASSVFCEEPRSDRLLARTGLQVTHKHRSSPQNRQFAALRPCKHSAVAAAQRQPCPKNQREEPARPTAAPRTRVIEREVPLSSWTSTTPTVY